LAACLLPYGRQHEREECQDSRLKENSIRKVYYDRLQTITLFFHEFFERVSPGTWRCSASSRLRIRPWKPFQTLLQEAIVCLERESFLMGGSFFNLDGELWLTLRKSRLVVVTILPSGIKTQDYDQTNERFPDEAIKLTLFHGHLQMTQKEKKKTADRSFKSSSISHLSSFSFFLFVEGWPGLSPLSFDRPARTA